MQKRILTVVGLLSLAPILLSGAFGQNSENQKQTQDSSAAEPVDASKPAAATSEAGKSPATAGSPVDPKRYLIGAEDSLLIRVWREPDLSGAVIVRPDGKISLPLVNEIQASGLTPEELSKNISQALTKYMTHPEVSVSVQEVNSKKYFIVGEVLKPGSFSLVVPTTVMEALASAGGFKDFANTKKILIIRGTQRFKFNYKDVVKGKHLEQNILLQPGDQIVVP